MPSSGAATGKARTGTTPACCSPFAPMNNRRPEAWRSSWKAVKEVKSELVLEFVMRSPLLMGCLPVGRHVGLYEPVETWPRLFEFLDLLRLPDHRLRCQLAGPGLRTAASRRPAGP